MNPVIKTKSEAELSDKPARRLRVAVLNRIFKSTGGGAERYSIALVEQLAAQHEIHVFAQDIDHHWPGVHYHRVPVPLVRPRWINQLWFASVTWLKTRRGFDVVHSHENTWHGNVQTVHVLPVRYNLFVGRTGWRLAMRWFKVITSPRLITYLALEKFRYAVGDGRAIVLPSKSLENTMLSTFAGIAPALKILTPGIAQVVGVASSAAQCAARKALHLPQQGKCILFVGNDYKKKGLPTLLIALQRLDPECFLAVVGNPSQQSLVSAEIERLGEQSRVFFLGSLRSVDQAYEAADCLAHPTLEDTFAMVVLEAMAHGLPVVVSGPNFCGIASLLSDGRNALLLPDPLDADELASLLNSALYDADHRGLLSLGALVFAEHHLWSQQALKLNAMYQSVSKAAG